MKAATPVWVWPGMFVACRFPSFSPLISCHLPILSSLIKAYKCFTSQNLHPPNTNTAWESWCHGKLCWSGSSFLFLNECIMISWLAACAKQGGVYWCVYVPLWLMQCFNVLIWSCWISLNKNLYVQVIVKNLQSNRWSTFHMATTGSG